MRQLGRSLYRLALVLLGVTLVLSLTTGGLVFWVVKYPASAWNFVHKHFLPEDLKVNWEAVTFKADRKSWLRWDIEWHVKNLKIEKTKPFIEFPIDSVDLVFSLELFSPRTRLSFSQVQAIATQRVRWTLSHEERAEAEPLNPYQKLYSAYLRYPYWANRYGTVAKMEINLKDIQLLGLKADPVTASLRIAKPKSESEPKSIVFDLKMDGAKVQSEVAATVMMDNFDTRTPFLLATLKWNDGQVRLAGETKWLFGDDRFTFTYKGKGGIPHEKGEIEIDPDLTSTLTPRGAEAFVTFSVKGIPGPLVRLNKVAGEFRMPFSPDVQFSGEAATFKLNGPVELFFVDQVTRTHIEGPCKCKLPTELMVSLQGRLFTKELFSKPSYKLPVAEVSIQAESLKNRLFTADLSASAKILRSASEWYFEPEVNSHLSILAFHDLKGLLEAKNLMVPAPFDVLDGTVDITAKGPIVHNKEGSRTTVNVKTNLTSEHQKVATETQVQLAVDPSYKSMDVVLKLSIRDFQVELPPIDPIAGIPAFRADPRFQMEPQVSQSAQKAVPPRFKVRLSWAATTDRPGAIRLLSRYANPHIPISMDIQRGIAGDVAGYIKLEPFQIQYLRRTLTVEQLRILADERDKAADFPVDGRVRVDQTQYAVFMEISGTLRAPFIKLSSEPELPRSDIISVLLFDRKQDQLAGGDAETAGQFEAAMADRAIGLLGLWAFASTPIRSFSYNASTKVYAATVAVGEGVTASVGTNWEEAAHLEVRKRISKRWVLTASWTPSERDETQAGRLVLQWEKRF